MVVYINGRRAQEVSIQSQDNIICFAKTEYRENALKQLEIDSFCKSGGTRFESHKGFDYISIVVPDIIDHSGYLEVFFTPKKLLILHDDHDLIKEVEEVYTDNLDAPAADVLILLFQKLIENDFNELSEIEDSIADLEDALAADEKIEYADEISRLRKLTLILKRYYQPLLALLEDLEENRNNFITHEQMRIIHFQTNRVERLYHSVINLRDYITQVREAYQAEIDISLNKTMQFFTVITTIFLPLTLIAGWYGMNLKMPEYLYDNAYPIVIVVCVLVVIASVAYFRRQKWF